MKAWYLIPPCVVLLMFGGMFLGWKELRKHQSTVVEESVEERSQSLRDAYLKAGSGAGEIDPELLGVAEQFFRKLRVAFRDEDEQALTALVSGRAMFDHTVRAGLVKTSSSKERRAIRAGFVQALGPGLVKAAGLMKFESFTVVHLVELKQNEFVAYVRMQDPEIGTYSKMRWWLIKDRDDRWVAYDYEELDTGIRTSTLLGVLMQPGATEKPWFEGFTKVLTDLSGSSGFIDMADKLSGMEEDIDAVLAQNPPRDLEPMLRMLKTSALVINEEFEAGLEQIRLIDAIDPLMPSSLYQRGSCYLGLERWDEAVGEFTRYANVLGWDADVHEMLGSALVGKGDMEQAVDHAERGLDDNKESAGCLAVLAVALPADRRSELEPLIRKMADPEFACEVVLDYAIELERLEVARLVFAVLQNDFPENEFIGYYEEELGG